MRKNTGQNMMEYMLLMAVVAFLVFLAMQPGGVLEQIATASQTLFSKGAEYIQN